MKILRKAHFNGNIIITDPIYLMQDNKYKEGYPNITDYIPVEVNEEMLQNPKISKLYAQSREEYNTALQQWQDTHIEDWDLCNYGDSMENLGIINYITSPTEYGNWSCAVLESHTKSTLGRFCADSGTVGIFLLDEVLSYNPQYADIKLKPWSVTMIENFRGTIAIVNLNDKQGYEAQIAVVGRGSVDFHTIQVGF